MTISNKFYIICINDSVCYGDRETKEQADLRAKTLATNNPGNVYLVAEARTAFQCIFENVSMIQENIE